MKRLNDGPPDPEIQPLDKKSKSKEINQNHNKNNNTHKIKSKITHDNTTKQRYVSPSSTTVPLVEIISSSDKPDVIRGDVETVNKFNNMPNVNKTPPYPSHEKKVSFDTYNGVGVMDVDPKPPDNTNKTKIKENNKKPKNTIDIINEKIIDIKRKAIKTNTNTDIETMVEIVEEKDRHKPQEIKFTKNSKQPEFDFTDFMSKFMCSQLSLLDFFQLSPAARRMVADGLKTIPKSYVNRLCAVDPSIQLLLIATNHHNHVTDITSKNEKTHENDINENNGVQEGETLNLYLSKIAKSSTPTHIINTSINDKQVVSHIDSGACIIAIRNQWIESVGIRKTQQHSRIGLRMATGSSPIIAGEVHDLICKFGNITCTFGALVVDRLDCDVLLGRPFLELVRAISVCETSIYHMVYDYNWVVVDGSTGVVTVQRKLLPHEDSEWSMGHFPRSKQKPIVRVIEKRIPEYDDNNNTTETDDSENANDEEAEQDFDLLRINMLRAFEKDEIEIISNQDMINEIKKEGTSFGVLAITENNQIDEFANKYLRERLDEIQNQLTHIQDSVRNKNYGDLKKLVSYIDENESYNDSLKFDIKTNTLKIISYNVNSIRSIIKKDKNEFDNLFENSDIVCLQEVRIVHENLTKLSNSFNKNDFHVVYSTCEKIKGYSSVATYIRKKVAPRILSYTDLLPGYTEEQIEGRYLEVEIENQIYIINVYFPNGRNPHRLTYKENFHNDFLHRVQKLRNEGCRVIICADVNIAHDEKDIHPLSKNMIESQSGYLIHERKWITSLIKIGFIDTFRNMNPLKNAEFTTWMQFPSARKKNIGMRFDYIFISTNLSESYRLSSTRHLYEYCGSDHVPVECIINKYEETYDLKTLNIFEDNLENDIKFFESMGIYYDSANQYFYQNQDGIKIIMHQRKQICDTLTRSFIVNDKEFKIGDIPECEQVLPELKKLLEKNITCFVNKGENGRTMKNVPNAVLDFIPPADNKLPIRRSNNFKPSEISVLKPWVEKMCEPSNPKLEEPSLPIRTVSVPVIAYQPGKDKARVCFNFQINKHLLPMVYPIKPVHAVLRSIALKKLFSCLDFASAYEQVPLDPASRWLTTVLLPNGTLKQFTVLCQGLLPSGEWFQYVVDGVVFKYDDQIKLPNEEPLMGGKLDLYRDDVTIGEKVFDPSLHLRSLKRMFYCLDYHNCSLSAHKAAFFLQRWTLLGYQCGHGEKVIAQDKVDAIIQWPFPTNQKELLSFMGFTVFLNHAIYCPSQTIHVLSNLQKHMFKDNNAYKKEIEKNKNTYYSAFSALKKLMTYRFAINIIEHDRTLILIGDSSNTGIGGISAHPLNAKDDDNVTASTLYVPNYILMRKFSDIERLRYSIPEKELSSLVHMYKKVEPEVGQKLVYITDHIAWVVVKNLETIPSKRAQKAITFLNSRSSLSGYPKWVFRKGSKNVDVDILSRASHNNSKIAIDEENDYIDKKIGVGPLIDLKLLSIDHHKIYGYLKKVTLEWEPYASITRYLQGDHEGLTNLSPEQYDKIKQLSRAYVCDHGKLYRKSASGVYHKRQVPDFEDIDRIMKKYHDSSGHPGIISTYTIMSQDYYWNGMAFDTKIYVQSCQICQSRQKMKISKYQLFRTIPPKIMMVKLGTDCLNLPKSMGYIGVHNIIDYSTGWAMAIPVKNVKSFTIIKSFEKWISIFGAPMIINVDNASYFIGDEFMNWANKNNIQVLVPSKGHSQGNGLIERFNLTFTIILCKTMMEQNAPVDKWPNFIDEALKIYRTRYSRKRGMSPYERLFKQKYEPDQHFQNMVQNYEINDEELMMLLEVHYDLVHQLINKDIDKQRKLIELDDQENQFDNPTPVKFVSGDLVWRSCKNSTNFLSENKLKAHWEGPYRIHESLGNGAYVLYDMTNQKIIKGTWNHLDLTKHIPEMNWYRYSLHRNSMFYLRSQDFIINRRDQQEINRGNWMFASQTFNSFQKTYGNFDLEIFANDEYNHVDNYIPINDALNTDWSHGRNVFAKPPPDMVSQFLYRLRLGWGLPTKMVVVIFDAQDLREYQILFLNTLANKPPSKIITKQEHFKFKQYNCVPRWTSTLLWDLDFTNMDLAINMLSHDFYLHTAEDFLEHSINYRTPFFETKELFDINNIKDDHENEHNNYKLWGLSTHIDEHSPCMTSSILDPPLGGIPTGSARRQKDAGEWGETLDPQIITYI